MKQIGSTVKHEAKDRLAKLARSGTASTAVDGLTDFIADPKSHAAATKIGNLKEKSKTLWTNAMRDDEAKIERTKNATKKALEITEKLCVNADPDGEVAHTFADAARRMKDIVDTGKNREEVLELSKTLGKDVWERLSTRAKGNEHFTGMRGLSLIHI